MLDEKVAFCPETFRVRNLGNGGGEEISNSNLGAKMHYGNTSIDVN
jgi:hypothetical protein